MQLQPNVEALLVLARLNLKQDQVAAASSNVDRALALEPANSGALALKRDIAARPAVPPGGAAAAPYPVQRALTAPMKAAGAAANDYHRMQVWAGQSAAMAQAIPAGELVTRIWEQTRTLL